MIYDDWGLYWEYVGMGWGFHRGYRWMVLVGRRVLRVMAMVRDLSGILVGY